VSLSPRANRWKWQRRTGAVKEEGLKCPLFPSFQPTPPVRGGRLSKPPLLPLGGHDMLFSYEQKEYGPRLPPCLALRFLVPCTLPPLLVHDAAPPLRTTPLSAQPHHTLAPLPLRPPPLACFFWHGSSITNPVFYFFVVGFYLFYFSRFAWSAVAGELRAYFVF